MSIRSKKSWEYLKPGDTVDIIAPASHTSQLALDSGVEWLRSLGLVPRLRKGLIKGDLFFAANLDFQKNDLLQALHSDSKAIWCVRGGYGSMRLIPMLNKLRPPSKPKVLLGFSDITALHLFLNQKWNWPSLHSRNISAMRKEDHLTPDRRSTERLLFGTDQEITFRKLKPLNDHAKEERSIQGRIVGGNLRILQSSLGTPWEIQAKNKILFIEDIGERGYSVHRMLEQLKQAKLIDRGLKALAIGQFTDGEEKNGKDLTMDAIKRIALELPYPVFSGLPCGHGQDNYPLPFNTSCELKLGKSIILNCQSGGF
jgi:muramoyltetrapeptide carboxypeptidase